jgi:hypothetical protein
MSALPKKRLSSSPSDTDCVRLGARDSSSPDFDMGCEFADHEWSANKPMLPNDPQGG